MTKTVLCALDINRPSEESRVLLQAKRLADLEDATLDVITVMPDYGASMVGAYFEEHQVQTAKDTAAQTLNDMVAEVLGEETNAKVRHLVAVGSVYEEVLKAAKLAGTSLIVIGAHRLDFKDFLLGPNAARVVRHAHCSVHVVR